MSTERWSTTGYRSGVDLSRLFWSASNFGPVSQDFLSLGIIVAATIFPEGNCVALIKRSDRIS